jgi:hypothetical protein
MDPSLVVDSARWTQTRRPRFGDMRAGSQQSAARAGVREHSHGDVRATLRSTTRHYGGGATRR